MSKKDEVTQLATKRLSESGYGGLRSVICEYDEEHLVLTLRGRVSCYYLKQMAQSMLVGIDEVRRIHNLLEVEE